MSFWDFMQYRFTEALIGVVFTIVVVAGIIIYSWASGKSVGDILTSKKKGDGDNEKDKSRSYAYEKQINDMRKENERLGYENMKLREILLTSGLNFTHELHDIFNSFDEGKD